LGVTAALSLLLALGLFLWVVGLKGTVKRFLDDEGVLRSYSLRPLVHGNKTSQFLLSADHVAQLEVALQSAADAMQRNDAAMMTLRERLTDLERRARVAARTMPSNISTVSSPEKLRQVSCSFESRILMRRDDEDERQSSFLVGYLTQKRINRILEPPRDRVGHSVSARSQSSSTDRSLESAKIVLQSSSIRNSLSALDRSSLNFSGLSLGATQSPCPTIAAAFHVLIPAPRSASLQLIDGEDTPRRTSMSDLQDGRTSKSNSVEGHDSVVQERRERMDTYRRTPLHMIGLDAHVGFINGLPPDQTECDGGVLLKLDSAQNSINTMGRSGVINSCDDTPSLITQHNLGRDQAKTETDLVMQLGECGEDRRGGADPGEWVDDLQASGLYVDNEGTVVSNDIEFPGANPATVWCGAKIKVNCVSGLEMSVEVSSTSRDSKIHLEMSLDSPRFYISSTSQDAFYISSIPQDVKTCSGAIEDATALCDMHHRGIPYVTHQQMSSRDLCMSPKPMSGAGVEFEKGCTHLETSTFVDDSRAKRNTFSHAHAPEKSWEHHIDLGDHESTATSTSACVQPHEQNEKLAHEGGVDSMSSREHNHDISSQISVLSQTSDYDAYDDDYLDQGEGGWMPKEGEEIPLSHAEITPLEISFEFSHFPLTPICMSSPHGRAVSGGVLSP